MTENKKKKRSTTDRNVSKEGVELLGQKLLKDREDLLGITQDDIVALYEEIMGFSMPKSTISSLENGHGIPKAGTLIGLVKFAGILRVERNKNYFQHPKTKIPFDYGEVIEILAGELNPITGEKIPKKKLALNGNGKSQ